MVLKTTNILCRSTAALAGQSTSRNVRLKNTCNTLAAGILGSSPVGKTELWLNGSGDKEPDVVNIAVQRESRAARIATAPGKSLITMSKPVGVRLSKNSSMAAKVPTPRLTQTKHVIPTRQTRSARRTRREAQPFRRSRSSKASRRGRRRRSEQQNQFRLLVPFLLSRNGLLGNTTGHPKMATPKRVTSSGSTCPASTIQLMQTRVNKKTSARLPSTEQSTLSTPGATPTLCDNLEETPYPFNKQQPKLLGGNVVAVCTAIQQFWTCPAPPIPFLDVKMESSQKHFEEELQDTCSQLQAAWKRAEKAFVALSELYRTLTKRNGLRLNAVERRKLEKLEKQYDKDAENLGELHKKTAALIEKVELLTESSAFDQLAEGIKKFGSKAERKLFNEQAELDDQETGEDSASSLLGNMTRKLIRIGT